MRSSCWTRTASSAHGTTARARSTGIMADDVVGRHVAMFYAPADIILDKPGEGLRLAAEQGRVENEGWRVRKDGSVFWAHVILTSLRDGDGLQQGFVKITRDMTARHRLEELEASSRQNERIPGAARARTAQPACADPQRGEHPQATRRQTMPMSCAAGRSSNAARASDEARRLFCWRRAASGRARFACRAETVDVADVIQLSVAASQPRSISGSNGSSSRCRHCRSSSGAT